MLLVLALLTALVGSIGLAGTMSMNVMERTREIGVLRAIGAHDRVVSKLVIVEGLLIGLLSFGFGGAGLLPHHPGALRGDQPGDLSLARRFTSRLRFALWLVVVLVLAVVASIVPARNASRLTIREVLAYE